MKYLILVKFEQYLQTLQPTTIPTSRHNATSVLVKLKINLKRSERQTNSVSKHKHVGYYTQFLSSRCKNSKELINRIWFNKFRKCNVDVRGFCRRRRR